MDVREISTGEVVLSVAEAGAGGRPLFLLHGFTGAKEDFTEWLDRLGAAGWHAVAPDHRGHGSSGKPESDEAYSLAIMATDGLALADALGWARFALLGHSMGGYIAQRMALIAPARIDALILMDTGHGPVQGLDLAEAMTAVEVVRTVGMDGLADILASRDSPLDTPAHRRTLKERPGYAEFGERKLRATSPHMYASLVPELLGGDDTLSGLAALQPKPPTLVIVGEQDTPFLGASTRMANALRASTAVIPDAGHSPQFENPDAWWSSLSGFLAQLRAPAP